MKNRHRGKIANTMDTKVSPKGTRKRPAQEGGSDEKKRKRQTKKPQK